MTNFMRKAIAASVMLFTVPVYAVDGTITFTGFSHNPDNTSSTTFADFTWGNSWFSDSAVAVSAANPYAIFSSGSTFVKRADGGSFNFDGITLWSRNGESIQMWVSLTNNGVSVYNGKAIGASERINLDSTHTVWNSPYAGPVTGVSFAFKTNGGGLGDAIDLVRLAADDFRFRNALPIANAQTPVTPVPEPSIAALLLAGLCALAFKAFRKNKLTR